MAIKASVLAALVAAGVSATTPTQDIKKAYFKAAAGPLSGAQLPILLQALNGDASVVVDDAAAAAEKAANPAKPKAEKAPKAPRAAKAAPTTETPADALARLKADGATSARWARVQEVLEMGKRGPIRVRIVCDDKGPNGETLTRDIKVQDLFQVKFSAGYKKAAVKKAEPVAAAVAADPIA